MKLNGNEALSLPLEYSQNVKILNITECQHPTLVWSINYRLQILFISHISSFIATKSYE
ncbi:hypothetical protein MTR_1g094120 [Medicago truncatula]|uniref:Uncharacterized protein n=1 Tax=Medicago truncatula TaxID=3880 RepID=A0A072VPZ5_MEDTR|nr:hypothetical protein MTR_1g094120 [Medicago truncatula]